MSRSSSISSDGRKEKVEATVGARLRWVREQRQLTLAEVGRLSGLTTSYLSRLELGGRTNPTRRTVEALCLALEIRSGWLLTGAGEPWVWPQRPIRPGEPAKDLASRKARESERSLLIMRWALQDKLNAQETLEALRSVLEEPAEPSPELNAMAIRIARRLVSQLQERLSEGGVLPLIAEPGLKEMGRVSYTVGGTTITAPAVIQTKGLTAVGESDKQPVMKSEMARLLRRLNSATKRRGSKTELARHMGVPRSCISVWLSGVREPGGAATLKLLHWFQNQQGNESP
jgi:transcriptional regulator with XRE-family HTH domain